VWSQPAFAEAPSSRAVRRDRHVDGAPEPRPRLAPPLLGERRRLPAWASLLAEVGGRRQGRRGGPLPRLAARGPPVEWLTGSPSSIAGRRTTPHRGDMIRTGARTRCLGSKELTSSGTRRRCRRTPGQPPLRARLRGALPDAPEPVAGARAGQRDDRGLPRSSRRCCGLAAAHHQPVAPSGGRSRSSSSGLAPGLSGGGGVRSSGRRRRRPSSRPGPRRGRRAREAPAAASLDNPIPSRVAPVLVAFVSRPEWGEKPPPADEAEDAMANLLAHDVVPFLEGRHRTDPGPEKRALVGTGSSAWRAAYAASAPEVIRRAGPAVAEHARHRPDLLEAGAVRRDVRGSLDWRTIAAAPARPGHAPANQRFDALRSGATPAAARCPRTLRAGWRNRNDRVLRPPAPPAEGAKAARP
jgi:hypothetical protein